MATRISIPLRFQGIPLGSDGNRINLRTNFNWNSRGSTNYGFGADFLDRSGPSRSRNSFNFNTNDYYGRTNNSFRFGHSNSSRGDYNSFNFFNRNGSGGYAPYNSSGIRLHNSDSGYFGRQSNTWNYSRTDRGGYNPYTQDLFRFNHNNSTRGSYGRDYNSFNFYNNSRNGRAPYEMRNSSRGGYNPYDQNSGYNQRGPLHYPGQPYQNQPHQGHQQSPAGPYYAPPQHLTRNAPQGHIAHPQPDGRRPRNAPQKPEERGQRPASTVGIAQFQANQDQHRHEGPRTFTEGVKGAFGYLNKFLDVLFEFFRDPEMAKMKAKIYFPVKDDSQRIKPEWAKEAWETNSPTTTKNYDAMIDQEGPGYSRSRRSASRSDPTKASEQSRQTFNQVAPNSAPANPPAPSAPTSQPQGPAN